MLQEKPLIFYIKIGAFSYMKKQRKNGITKKSKSLKYTKRNSIGNSGTNQKLLPQENPLVINENLLNFNIEALVRRILNYCNRKDLPEAVKMSIIEQFYNKIISDNESNNLSEVDIRNLKRLKMNDTEFEFNFQEQVIVEKNSIYFLSN